MQVEVLSLEQGVTRSFSSEDLSAEGLAALTRQQEVIGGRYVIFPTTAQMLIWQAAVACTAPTQPLRR